jgi:DNA-binding transcriptional regulator LsrR (DeoR family)
LRSGAEYFTEPANPAQRRYEALRAYFVEGATAAQVADRYGYSTASVHQMATLLADRSERG